MAFLHIFNFTRNVEFLNKSVDYAIQSEQKDGMLLKIVESITKKNKKKAEEIAKLIDRDYYRNKAYATILEQCNALELAEKISCMRILSSSLKRLSQNLDLPDSIEIARMIPDPYYKALALINIMEREEIEGLREEVNKTIEKVRSKYLKERLERELKT